MTLLSCPECGKDLSSKARACPHCGAPQKKKWSVIHWIGAAFFAVMIPATIVLVRKADQKTVPPSTAPAPTVAAGPASAAPSAADDDEELSCHRADVQHTLFSIVEEAVGKYGTEGKAVGVARAHQLFQVASPELDLIYIAQKDPQTGALQCSATLRFPLEHLNRANFIVPPAQSEAYWNYEGISYFVRPTSDGTGMIVQLEDADKYGHSIGLEILLGVLDAETRVKPSS
ncbi:MAG: zinc ribbon domain-containing protein [Nevskia sp.]|nr:zinc ribbon domain-containing protein [Nevskia sp.]